MEWKPLVHLASTLAFHSWSQKTQAVQRNKRTKGKNEKQKKS